MIDYKDPAWLHAFSSSLYGHLYVYAYTYVIFFFFLSSRGVHSPWFEWISSTCVSDLCTLPPPHLLSLQGHTASWSVPTLSGPSGHDHSCPEGCRLQAIEVVTTKHHKHCSFTLRDHIQGPQQRAGCVHYLVQVMSQGAVDLSRF